MQINAMPAVVSSRHGKPCIQNSAVIAFHCLISVILIYPMPFLPGCALKWLQSAVTDDYGKAVARVRRLARINCFIVPCNHFLSYCVLTWASVVVLGAVLEKLSTIYFEVAVALLVLQAIQFGAAVAWRNFLQPLRPARLRARKLRGILYVSQAQRSGLAGLEIGCIFLFMTYSVNPVFFFKYSCATKDSPADPVLSSSIRIFFGLVFLNGIIAAAGVLCGRLLFYYHFSPCLGDYFDTIIRVSMKSGLAGAAKVKVVDVLLEMIGQEFQEIQIAEESLLAEQVMEVYKHMIHYAYNTNRCFEATLKAMECDNTNKREAAVYLVGCWVDYEASKLGKLKRLRFEGALIRRLIELALSAASSGRTTRLAGGSLHKLAKHEPFAIMVAQKDVVALIAAKVVDAVDLGEHLRFNGQPRAFESLPVLIKTLVVLMEQLQPAGCAIAMDAADHAIATGVDHAIATDATDHATDTDHPIAMDAADHAIATGVDHATDTDHPIAMDATEHIAIAMDVAGTYARHLGYLQSKQLNERLLYVFQCRGSSKRLQAVVGYVLHRTLQNAAFSNDILLGHLMAREAAPTIAEDIFQDERDTYFGHLTSIVPAQWDTNRLLLEPSATINRTSRFSCPEGCKKLFLFLILCTSVFLYSTLLVPRLLLYLETQLECFGS